MIRQIIKIDEEKCDGCGLCIQACHEGAIGLVNGKAKLLRDDYCDGLGNCLPACPAQAITFEQREAAEFDEEAVKKAQAAQEAQAAKPAPFVCPGSQIKTIRPKAEAGIQAEPVQESPAISCLKQWPVQIKLVPVSASYLDGADLLIAADCTAYAYGNFHQKFMKNKVTLIGCPKLDEGDYSDKLAEILRLHDLNSITLVRMDVPCCGGMVQAFKTAMLKSGKMIPWQVVTIGTEGEIL